MESQDLQMQGASSLFDAKSIAILGDSDKPGRGQIMREHLRDLNFTGNIYSVNPKYSNIEGRRCFNTLSELPEKPDLVAVLLRASSAVAALDEIVSSGARAAVIVASGFVEIGTEGLKLQEELRRKARSANLEICGPNCYGIVNLHSGFAAYSGSLPSQLKQGNIAFFSQSGALTHAVLNPASRRGIGFSLIASTGNEAVTTLADYIRVAIKDLHTKVIALFVEGLRDTPHFVDALVEAREAGKAVVICKVGRSALAQQAATAHSGAVTGNDVAFTALCDATGAIRVNSLNDLIETMVLLSSGVVIREPVAFISISGGGNGLIADSALENNIALSELTESTKEKLRQVLPDFASASNPLDLTGAVGENPAITINSVNTLRNAQEVGLVAFAINTGTADNLLESDFYKSLMDQASQKKDPARSDLLFFTMTSGPIDDEFQEIPHKRKTPLLAGLETTLKSLSAVIHKSQRSGWKREVGVRDFSGSRINVPESLAKKILKSHGIDIPEEIEVHTPVEAITAAGKIGFPVVIKSNSSLIPHKTEVGCVKQGIHDEQSAATAAEQIQRRSLEITKGVDDSLIVAAEIPPGLDLLIGAVGVPGVGHMLVVGPGGVATEISQGHKAIFGPLTHTQAHEFLMSTSLRPHFEGFRGQQPADINAVIKVLTTLSEIYNSDPHVLEIEINPLRLTNDRSIALDALITRTANSQ